MPRIKGGLLLSENATAIVFLKPIYPSLRVHSRTPRLIFQKHSFFFHNMSLPEATKVVSEKPAKNTVTAPTDRVEQEKDIDRKLRLYGVIQAFSNGRMPDNAQIDEALLYVHDHSLVDTNLLSAEGKKLVQDARDIIDTVLLRPLDVTNVALTKRKCNIRCAHLSSRKTQTRLSNSSSTIPRGHTFT